MKSSGRTRQALASLPGRLERIFQVGTVLAARDDGGVQHGVPARLLEQAGLVALERLPARQAGMWLVDWNGTLGVLPGPDG